MDPIKTARTQFDFLRQLHDREALVGRERQRRFMINDGYVGWSGPAIVELLRQFIIANRMMIGGFVVGDRAVSLADITCPILAFVGERDEIGQPEAVRGIARAATGAEVFEVVEPAGHLGLVLGSNASRTTWPIVSEWIQWREGAGPRPALVQPMKEADALDPQPSTAHRTSYALTQIADISSGVAKHLVRRVGTTVRSSQHLADDATHALPRLIRLGRLQSSTQVSLGEMLAERARRDPDGECFLFNDRVHTNAATSARVDHVVRGLISVGVREGDHIGVLMETRPSALVAAAALSRVGAVAVMLPPDDIAGALRQAPVSAIVVDPDNVEMPGMGASRLLVLGGGDSRRIPRPSGAEVVDLEQIDPAQVTLPAWYRPNPGTARDLAFILFSTSGDVTRRRLITNHRWATAAFATASVAALSRADTVYCLTPLHHPAGLLTAVGGAFAGGSRIALSRHHDPELFAEEVRRYGVTVVSYTWTMLHHLVVRQEPATAPAPLPIRLFLGSGMPVGLWERVVERFPAASVVELWATTECDAVLANVSGAKPGAKGRPLPGSAEVRLAAYDAVTGTIARDLQGFHVPCTPGQVGVLLANSRANHDTSARTMRGVFTAGDCWLPTDDLFRQDADGDYWLVGTTRTVLRTEHGPVYPQPIVDALGSLDTVDLAVAHGTVVDGRAVSVASVTTWPGRELRARDLDTAFQHLPAGERPDVVQVVDEIPVTPSYRPAVERIAELGVRSAAVWTYDAATATYVDPPARG
jgi:putative long chain acyl-CoA synthase